MISKLTFTTINEALIIFSIKLMNGVRQVLRSLIAADAGYPALSRLAVTLSNILGFLLGFQGVDYTAFEHDICLSLIELSVLTRESMALRRTIVVTLGPRINSLVQHSTNPQSEDTDILVR